MKKVVNLILLIIAVSFFTLVLLKLSPFDVVKSYQQSGVYLSDEKLAQLNKFYAKDGSALIQYYSWLKNAVLLDFGDSFLYKADVLKTILSKLSISSIIIVGAFIGGFFLSFFMAIGMYSSRIIRKIVILISSIPSYVIGLSLMIIFALKLNIFPIALTTPIGIGRREVDFFTSLVHSVLPLLSIILSIAPNMAIRMHAYILELMSMDFVSYQKVLGYSKVKILMGARKNILLNFVVLQFSSMGTIISQTLVAEQIFSYTGIGRSVIDATLVGDIPYIMGVSVVIAIIVFLFNNIGRYIAGKYLNRGIKNEI